ncbi:MAG TPA: PilZ domain-containing protein [Candidatus Sulfotelmatobacter sp.]|nr:PilZ domain-containing protein [Candidatus Sulfotelmatobacter sp.]
MSTATGTDWTRILSDPDLVRQVGKLLQAYREAPADKREQILLAAMRDIKQQAAASRSSEIASSEATPTPVPTATTDTPPFEPDLFQPNWSTDRRRHPRIKCFVAVEIRVDDSATPLWGNLSNTSVGGCLVETATPVKPGAKVDVGLWLANGKIWVKGFALSGTVTRTGRTAAVRVRFDTLAPPERDSLRQFLKFVQDTTRASQSESNYLQLLK